MDLDPNDPIDAIALAWLRERPHTDVDSIGIVTRIWQVAKLFGDDRTRLLKESGADSATLDLLSTLLRNGPPYRMSTKELATSSLITAGAITQRVDRAEHQGLVTRHQPTPGTRRVDIELTDLGHRTVERLVDNVLGHEIRLLKGLSAEEQQELEQLLRRLLNEVQAALGHPPAQPRHVGDP